MREYIIKFWRVINMKMIGKVKNYFRMRKNDYIETKGEYNTNKLTYEDYVLRSQLSVFQYRRDL